MVSAPSPVLISFTPDVAVIVFAPPPALIVLFPDVTVIVSAPPPELISLSPDVPVIVFAPSPAFTVVLVAVKVIVSAASVLSMVVSVDIVYSFSAGRESGFSSLAGYVFKVMIRKRLTHLLLPHRGILKTFREKVSSRDSKKMCATGLWRMTSI
jgi:hypothetical protein